MKHVLAYKYDNGTQKRNYVPMQGKLKLLEQAIYTPIGTYCTTSLFVITKGEL